MRDLMDWLTGRLMEISTYVGMALIYTASLGLTSTNETANQGLVFFNQYGATVGGFLVALSKRRHRDQPDFVSLPGGSAPDGVKLP
jgi:hypothetical protein